MDFYSFSDCFFAKLLLKKKYYQRVFVELVNRK